MVMSTGRRTVEKGIGRGTHRCSAQQEGENGHDPLAASTVPSDTQQTGRAHRRAALP